MSATLVDELQPGDAAWLKLMTASKVAAVLGVSTYDSPRSIWHKMRGDVDPEPAKKNQLRGHYLEPSVLAWFYDQHPELIREKTGTFIHSNGWAAATPDSMASGIPVEAKTDAGDGDDWGTPGTDEVPVHIAAQCMWTMHVLGAEKIYVPMLAPRLEFREYVLSYDPDLATDIEQRCKALLDSLDTGRPPALDSHPATFETLKRVNPSIEYDGEVQLTAQQARLFCNAVTDLKAAEAQHNLAKSTIAEAMGTARRAFYGTELIARRQNTASGVAALYAAKPIPTIPETKAAA